MCSNTNRQSIIDDATNNSIVDNPNANSVISQSKSNHVNSNNGSKVNDMNARSNQPSYTNDTIIDSCVDAQNEGANLNGDVISKTNRVSFNLPSNNINVSKGNTIDNNLTIDTFEDDNSVKIKIKKNNNSSLPNFNPININETGLRKSASIRDIQNKKNSFLNNLGFIGMQEIEKTDKKTNHGMVTIITTNEGVKQSDNSRQKHVICFKLFSDMFYLW